MQTRMQAAFPFTVSVSSSKKVGLRKSLWSSLVSNVYGGVEKTASLPFAVKLWPKFLSATEETLCCSLNTAIHLEQQTAQKHPMRGYKDLEVKYETHAWGWISKGHKAQF